MRGFYLTKKSGTPHPGSGLCPSLRPLPLGEGLRERHGRAQVADFPQLRLRFGRQRCNRSLTPRRIFRRTDLVLKPAQPMRNTREARAHDVASALMCATMQRDFDAEGEQEPAP